MRRADKLVCLVSLEEFFEAARRGTPAERAAALDLCETFGHRSDRDFREPEPCRSCVALRIELALTIKALEGVAAERDALSAMVESLIASGRGT